MSIKWSILLTRLNRKYQILLKNLIKLNKLSNMMPDINNCYFYLNKCKDNIEDMQAKFYLMGLEY